jgi:hypothetical protein
MGGYKDFLAGPAGEYEHFDAAVAAAFQWVKANNINVVNFETVSVAELVDDNDPQAAAFSTAVSHQIVRVWYMQG